MNNTAKPAAIITGGSRGIGAATAIAFAENGYNVLINYQKNEAAAREVLEKCRLLGSDAHMFSADVSVFDEARALTDEAVSLFGAENISALVNNAGITRDTLMLRMSRESFDEVVSTNLGSTFNMCRTVSPIMFKNRSGSIINMSSAAALHGNAGQANYSASKAAVIGLTKSLAKELSGRGVTVNAVAPGFVETDMTAKLSDAVKEKAVEMISLGRFAKPEEIASVVVFLASRDARYITGQVISVDGGLI